MQSADLTAHERRILAYLDQHGPTHREKVVCDLASDDSMIGYRRQQGRGWTRGSNGATPMIMANWCRRLEAAGLVRHVRSDDRHWQYLHHEITDKGKALLRVPA